jgi:hypothetical protein
MSLLTFPVVSIVYKLLTKHLTWRRQPALPSVYNVRLAGRSTPVRPQVVKMLARQNFALRPEGSTL